MHVVRGAGLAGVAAMSGVGVAVAAAAAGSAAQRDAGAVRTARADVRRRPDERRPAAPAGAYARADPAGAGPRDNPQVEAALAQLAAHAADAEAALDEWAGREASGAADGSGVVVDGWAVRAAAGGPDAAAAADLRRWRGVAAGSGALGDRGDRDLWALAENALAPGPHRRGAARLGSTARSAAAPRCSRAARRGRGAAEAARPGSASEPPAGVPGRQESGAALAGPGVLKLCSPVRAALPCRREIRREAANKDPFGVARPDRRCAGAGQHVQHQPRGRSTSPTRSSSTPWRRTSATSSAPRT
jgi:hypothetical protein